MHCERTIEYGHEYPHTEHLEGLKTIVTLVLGLKSSVYESSGFGRWARGASVDRTPDHNLEL